MVRIEVVPTAHTFRFALFAVFTISAAFSVMIACSESILCLVKSSTSTGLKVPSPTCRVISENSIPLSSNLFSSCLEKCSPAVGAATAPSSFAKIVWYLSSSEGSTSRLIYFGSGVSPSSVIFALKSS